MKEDDELLPDMYFDLSELREPVPEPEPLPPPQSQEGLKAALAKERFLELSGDEQFYLVAADMAAAHQMLDAGLLAEHGGKHVAVLRRQFVGADPNPEQLRDDISRVYNIHPFRVAEIFIDDGS
jgi:hypothetical protein